MAAKILVCALLIWGAATADAAATRWFVDEHPIPPGDTVEVAAAGPLKLNLKGPRGRSVLKAGCAVRGIEAFYNTPETGLDETRAISFSCTASCGAVAVTPVGLPWASTLEESAWPLPDEWAGVGLDVACAGTDYGVFEGALRPGIGDNDEQGFLNGKPIDDPDYALNFSPKRGVLTGPGGVLTLQGNYKLGTKGVDEITGECDPQTVVCGPGDP